LACGVTCGNGVARMKSWNLPTVCEQTRSSSAWERGDGQLARSWWEVQLSVCPLWTLPSHFSAYSTTKSTTGFQNTARMEI